MTRGIGTHSTSRLAPPVLRLAKAGVTVKFLNDRKPTTTVIEVVTVNSAWRINNITRAA